MWLSLPSMRDRWGAEGALAVGRAAERGGRRDRRLLRGASRSTPGSGAAATSRSRPPPAHDDVLAGGARRLPRAGRGRRRDRARARRRSRRAAPRRPSAPASSSPTRRPSSRRASRSACATRLRAAGVEICEGSPVRSVRAGADQVEARTERRARCGPSRAVLAIGGAAKGLRGPLRGRLSVASSHIVITEPVPELLEEIGWTGGECITDSRALVDYFRTTPDGRIAFGWGGGRIAMGARTEGRAELDAEVVAPDRRRTCTRLLPGPRGTRDHPRLGRPDRRHARPTCRWSCRCAAAAPSPPPATPATASAPRTWSAARSPRWRSTATTKPRGSPSSTPRRRGSRPSPSTGSAAKRSARGIQAKEEAELAGREPGRISSALARVPELIGFHIGR